MHSFILKTARKLSLLSVLCLSLANAAVAGETASAMLETFHSGLTERYPGVSHLSTDELAQMQDENVILFDVRKQSEYDVSRIDGAIRVSPSISPARFLSEYAGAVQGATVVFYCSVGERSSRLAERVMSQGMDAKAVHNLAGGIFKWHNEYKNVVADTGETMAIHPFNRKWGRLLERRDDASMKPKRKP